MEILGYLPAYTALLECTELVAPPQEQTQHHRRGTTTTVSSTALVLHVPLCVLFACSSQRRWGDENRDRLSTPRRLLLFSGLSRTEVGPAFNDCETREARWVKLAWGVSKQFPELKSLPKWNSRDSKVASSRNLPLSVYDPHMQHRGSQPSLTTVTALSC